MSTLLQLNEIAKSYGHVPLLHGIQLDLSASDRVGVIGRNGAGKSTLCRILLGEEEPDGGSVVRNRRLRMGYLEQRQPFAAGETLVAFLTRHSGKPEWESAKLAARFQLGNELLDVPIEQLAGGFQTRAKLAGMLLCDPNFLVLDEPTNYLDLRTLILLERFLRNFNGGYLIVSHDREFLKRTCSKTLEVERGEVTLFPGDIEAYLAYKEEAREQEIRYNKNIEAKRRQLQSFVDRYRVRASTASRAQSKLKELEKLQPIAVEHSIATARIRIPQVEPRKGVALRCEGLAIGYPDNTVAREISFEIERGEHVAVLGDNGQGKTTLLRTIAGGLPPRGGTFAWGHELEAAYYAQHVYATLPENLTVVSYLERVAARDVTRQDVLDLAGSFLFQGDDVEKAIGVLSGGERARVCLAGLLLSRKPILLLDEPTNHLDFETVEALGNALRNYRGTIFFVSHDRTFVRLVATSIVEARDGRVTLYPADYETYVYRAEREIDERSTTDDDPGGTRAEGTGAPTAKRSSHEERKELRARINKLRTRVGKLEARIESLEKEMADIDRHYLENPLDHSREKATRRAALEKELADTESEWLEMQAELEAAEAER